VSAAPAPCAGPIARSCATGRFVPFLRNRPIGSESVRAETGTAGRLRLRATTEITVHRFALRQTVIAGFTADLRPEWCTVETCVNTRRVSLEVEVGHDRAFTRYRSGEQARSGRCDLEHEPLLLVDNCFASHAVAALAARRRAPGTALFVSLPACEDLAVTRSGTLKVLLGGREFAPPALSLHLTPELDEHVWVEGDWVERLVIPQTQMRVEWTTHFPSTGGTS
jgi:hypothetical protein